MLKALKEKGIKIGLITNGYFEEKDGLDQPCGKLEGFEQADEPMDVLKYMPSLLYSQ